jgi:hypothetical protein
LTASCAAPQTARCPAPSRCVRAGSSLEDDERLLAGRGTQSGKGAAGKGLGTQERLAVAFRVEKKKVLTACLEALGGSA